MSAHLVGSHAQPFVVILLNCGGIIDVDDFFQLSEESVIIVVDSHRPFHLRNIHSGEEVCACVLF